MHTAQYERLDSIQILLPNLAGIFRNKNQGPDHAPQRSACSAAMTAALGLTVFPGAEMKKAQPQGHAFLPSAAASEF